MRIPHICLFLLWAFAGLSANAQRTLVPIVSFENIPVKIATNAPVSSAEIKNAFLAAGDEGGWEVVPAGDGELEGTYVKQNKHAIVVTIRYDAEKYSVLFKSSANMNQRASPWPEPNATSGTSGESQAVVAERKQRQLFANRPESPYRKAAPLAVIHPNYEPWVYDLLERVRRKLKRVTQGEVQR